MDSKRKSLVIKSEDYDDVIHWNRDENTIDIVDV